MDTSYDVRIYKTLIYEGATTTTYTVRWSVARRPWREPFKTTALAESFRASLTSAARRGEAFVITSGLPTSLHREKTNLRWLDFAMEYVDIKWPHLAPNSRRNTARALTYVTLSLLASDRGKPADDSLRRALVLWAFNTGARSAEHLPAELAASMRWLEGNTRKVADLAEMSVARQVMDGLLLKSDGKPAAAATVQRLRGVLVNLAEYAVERGLFAENPITTLAWTPPKIADSVDKRVVVNPEQASALLRAIAEQKPSGPRLVAYFGAMYYAALRPGEAASLRSSNLTLPKTGWGELYVEFSTPTAGARWTDSGVRREERQLKHRAKGETRPVPCPPALTKLLNEHLTTFGTGAGGLLFDGVRGGQLAESTYTRVWRKARESTLSEAEVASPLARRPYDLRHAAVSTWLNAGVPATQVAEWAGHSLAVLLRIYAKCLVGQEMIARQRIADALGDAGPAG